jgi:hypothetical protein
LTLANKFVNGQKRKEQRIMITIPIWLFIISIIIGFPLLTAVLIIISHAVYMCVNIIIEIVKIVADILKSMYEL